MPEFKVKAPDGNIITVNGPEGGTEEQAIAYAQANYKPEEKPFSLQDMAAENRSALGGHIGALGRGAISSAVGLPGEMAGLLNKGINKVEGWAGIKPEQTGGEQDKETPFGQEQVNRFIDKVVGDFGRPKNTTDEYLYSIGEAAPYFVGGPEAAATKIAGAVASGVGSKAGGDIGENLGGDTGRVIGGVVGGGLGGAAPGKVEKTLKTRAAAKAQFDAEELAVIGDSQFEHVREVGKQTPLAPQYMNALHDHIKATLADEAFMPQDAHFAPLFSKLSAFLDKGGGQGSVNDILLLHKAINRTIRSSPDKELKMAAGSIKDEIEGQLHAISPSMGKEFQDALGDWSIKSKIEDVQRMVEKAGNQAAVAGTGANIQNTMRQRMNEIFKNDKRMAGWPPGAREKLAEAISGSFAQNALRYAGKLAPTGPRTGAYTIAAMFYNFPLTATAATGLYGAKKLGEFLTHRQIEEVIIALEEAAPANRPSSAVLRGVRASTAGLPAQGAIKGAAAGLNSQNGSYDALENAQP